MEQQKCNDTGLKNVPVFVVYDGIDERVVDGGGFCYDCGDSFGIWRKDVGMPK